MNPVQQSVIIGQIKLSMDLTNKPSINPMIIVNHDWLVWLSMDPTNRLPIELEEFGLTIDNNWSSNAVYESYE